MRSKDLPSVQFDASMDLDARLGLVMSAHSSHGYVNRQLLVDVYGVTQVQAGGLIRDFLHAHGARVKWDATHTKYQLNEFNLLSAIARFTCLKVRHGPHFN